MDWTQVLEQLFELLIYPVITVAGIYLTYLIGVKIKELKQKANNESFCLYILLLFLLLL